MLYCDCQVDLRKERKQFFEYQTFCLKIVLVLLVIGIMIADMSSADGSNWNIDYDDPGEYLEPGEQSRISSQATIDALKIEFGECSGLEGLRDLYLWIEQEFSTYGGGGKLIGKTTIDQLLEEKKLSGCHDRALAYSAVARYLGYPTIMVDTAGLEWAEKFKLGLTTSYVGHVFVEVYIAPKWILVDPSSGRFIREYDASNPVIPITMGDEASGFYALLKGRDTWDYGVRDPESLFYKLRTFASSFDPSKIDIPSYQIERLDSITETVTSATKTATTTTFASTTSIASTQTIEQTETRTATRGFESHISGDYIAIIGIIVAIVVGTCAVLYRRRK